MAPCEQHETIEPGAEQAAEIGAIEGQQNVGRHRGGDGWLVQGVGGNGNLPTTHLTILDDRASVSAREMTFPPTDSTR